MGCLHSLLHFQLKALHQLFLKRCPPCPTTFHSVCPISPVFGSLHAITTYYLQNTELIQSYTCIMICRERKDRSLPWGIYIVEIILFSSPFPNTIITPPLASNLISGCSFSLSRRFWLSLTFTIFFFFLLGKSTFLTSDFLTTCDYFWTASSCFFFLHTRKTLWDQLLLLSPLPNHFASLLPHKVYDSLFLNLFLCLTVIFFFLNILYSVLAI